ncbi:UDP-N-acetylmuramoyl-L-alanyl-D-glutamate--2,6-diaminopimelate ligase [Candidatus Parcubacteria bacterium]|nr:UDP-N-acetylmuramoyl-L-alanyl-D-glutamate--2,6-diaminopimelate ligase [Candidatus Parcubacteria bacterium]
MNVNAKKLIKKFIPSFALNWYHFFLPLLGAFLYRFPSRKIKVIGITGTNGKTTVVHLISKILEQAGYKVASISSVRFKIGDREYKNTLKMTMPGRLKLQKFFREAVNSKCDFMVLEVTSEGIKQHRHRFIDFDTAVFTNLTQEHIESHGSFEKYKQAKGELFKMLKSKGISIVNLADENADYFLEFGANEKIGYKVYPVKSREAGIPLEAELFNKVKNPNVKIITAKNCELTAEGVKFSVNDVKFSLDLLGEFNIYNAIAAICAGMAQGVDSQTCKTALEKFKGIPGRMEIIARDRFLVIVDYAHTPDALKKVYQTVKQVSNNQKMIGVIGAAGGGRDKWKRPELGKIADQYCAQIIITNEDPYDENPEQILNEIEKGISIHKPYKIIDRKQAIKKALSLAKSGDAVVITGKGSEPWMCVANGKKIPWDDREIVKQALM